MSTVIIYEFSLSPLRYSYPRENRPGQSVCNLREGWALVCKTGLEPADLEFNVWQPLAHVWTNARFLASPRSCTRVWVISIHWRIHIDFRDVTADIRTYDTRTVCAFSVSQRDYLESTKEIRWWKCSVIIILYTPSIIVKCGADINRRAITIVKLN